MKTKRAFLGILITGMLILSMPACTWFGGGTTEQPAGEEQAAPGAPEQPPGQPPQQGQGPAEQGPAVTGQTPAPPAQQQPPQSQPQQGCTDSFAINGAPSIAPGQEFETGEAFQVDWPVVNTGTCTWSATYSLVMIGGEEMGASSPIALGSQVAPGDSVTLSVQMAAPAQAGEYVSAWKIANDDGQQFGKDNPPNAPLRVAISVVEPAASSPSGPEVARAFPLNTVAYGTDQSLTMGVQCFDLAEGETVSCLGSEADFKYTYAGGQGGNILPLNGTEFSGSMADKPGEADCEAETYYGLTLQLPLPVESSTGQYYCYHTDYQGDTAYGWLQPTDFGMLSITFDYQTYEPDETAFTPGQAIPIPVSPLVHSQGEQKTILIDKCFDMFEGEKAACNGSEADWKFRETDNLQVWALNGAEWGIGYSEEQPSKSTCQAKDYLSGATYLHAQYATKYFCIRMDYNGGTIYGWIRPTSFNTGGVTFDWTTYR